MTLQRLRQIGWASLLLICTTVFAALSLQVMSVKSEVKLAEEQVIALRERNMVLETEFQTRANQAQLAAWNAVDFGYEPPEADQFIGGEAELARFGTPRADTLPDPIQVARAGEAGDVPEFPLDVADDDNPASDLARQAAKEGRTAQSAPSVRIRLGQARGHGLTAGSAQR